jgi:hypothetical protein
LTALSVSGTAVEGGSLEPFRYRFEGRTAAGDSAISAWFQFDSSAMADGLVFTQEISQHKFLISGDIFEMNGQYDRFLGGGLTFPDIAPGPQNLPKFQSFVIQNTATTYFVQANSFGDPTQFIGGPEGFGYVYSGQWSFEPVPEPAMTCHLLVGIGLLSLNRRSRRKRRSERLGGAAN